MVTKNKVKKSCLLFLALCCILIMNIVALRYFLRGTYNNIKWYIECSFVRLTSKPIDQKNMELAEHVAHAGGEIAGLLYTNSLDALDCNYKKGCRVFELDFELTSDGCIVLMHDWKQSVEYLFGEKPHQYTLDDFRNEKANNNLKLLSLSDLENWISDKKDVKIIADAKRNTCRIYKRIKNESPAVSDRIIPQIYYMWQYPFVKKTGYRNIILTLYEAGYSDRWLIRFCMLTNITAITMNVERVIDGGPDLSIYKAVRVFAHTVNNTEIIEKLFTYGVYGVYSDSIFHATGID